eukprot:352193-Chlamydomonas_euryale.AAC.8
MRVERHVGGALPHQVNDAGAAELALVCDGGQRGGAVRDGSAGPRVGLDAPSTAHAGIVARAGAWHGELGAAGHGGHTLLLTRRRDCAICKRPSARAARYDVASPLHFCPAGRRRRMHGCWPRGFACCGRMG